MPFWKFILQRRPRYIFFEYIVVELSKFYVKWANGAIFKYILKTYFNAFQNVMDFEKKNNITLREL